LTITPIGQACRSIGPPWERALSCTQKGNRKDRWHPGRAIQASARPQTIGSQPSDPIRRPKPHPCMGQAEGRAGPLSEASSSSLRTAGPASSPAHLNAPTTTWWYSISRSLYSNRLCRRSIRAQEVKPSIDLNQAHPPAPGEWQRDNRQI